MAKHRAPEKIAFPTVTTHSHVIVIQFKNPSDRDLYRRWMSNEGWEAFTKWTNVRRDDGEETSAAKHGTAGR
jgi:hypothetical protein